MLNVKIFGLVGENLGDEVLGTEAAKIYSNLMPGAHVSIAELIADRASRNGVHSFFIDRKSLGGIWNIIREISSSDVVMIGGGSLVQDKLGITLLRGTLPFAFQVALIAKLLRKRVYTLPLGVDCLHTVLGRYMAFSFFKLCDHILVRDEMSKNNVLKYGSKSISNIEISPDPAFHYEGEIEKSKDRIAVISLSKENYQLDNMISVMRQYIASLVERGWHVKLLAMDERPEEEFKINESLVESMAHPNITLIPLGNTVHQTASIIRSSDMVVAMRLHAAILAYGYTPIIMISRTTKTDAFIKKYNISGIPLDELSSPDQLVDAESSSADLYENIHRENLSSIRYTLLEKFRSIVNMIC